MTVEERDRPGGGTRSDLAVGAAPGARDNLRADLRELWVPLGFAVAGGAAIFLVLPLALEVPVLYALSLVPMVALIVLMWVWHPRDLLTGRAAYWRGRLWTVLLPSVVLYWASLVSLRWFSPLVGDALLLFGCHLAAGFLLGTAIDDYRSARSRR